MTTQEAMEILSRLQAGHDIETVLNSIKAGSVLLQLRMVPETRLRYNLPYSAQMPADLLATGSPYLDSFIYKAAWSEPAQNRSCDISEYQSKYLKPYHAATFIEPQLDRTTPSAWTTVSRDDGLMRDLLAAYFTRDYHLCPVVQKDCFLEDMANGQTDCCSSLLVNVVLAYGCVSSPSFPIFSKLC